MSVSLTSRVEGAIWGVCVADALGGPAQFQEAGKFERITDLRYIDRYKQPAGSYSDDGAMTLALATSFLKSKMKYNHQLSIEYYIEWVRDGRFSTINRAWDVGRSTRTSLAIWKRCWERSKTDDFLESGQAKVNTKLKQQGNSGNGSLMRIVSIGVCCWQDVQSARAKAREQSQITHPSSPCLEACEVYTLLVSAAMSGDTKLQLHDKLSGFPFEDSDLKARLSQYESIEDWEGKTGGQMKSSGWVVDTLECALWAFFKYNSWKKGVLAVVNLGGDADTAGAVYGGLAGCFYGIESIPGEWRDKMVNKDFIGEIARSLSENVERESISKSESEV